MQHLLAAVAAVILTLGSFTFARSAVALDTGNAAWSFNGYGTLGLAHSSRDRADFLPNNLRSEGPGRSGSWNADLDSRLAFQVSAHPTSRFSAVVQVVGEHRSNGSYEAAVDWANLQYAVSPDFSVRVGRIAMGTFLTSDYRKVGYALPWVRPPTEIYRIVPISDSDGIDVTWRARRGEATFTTQVNYGRNEVDEIDGVAADNLLGIVSRMERNALQLHAGYLRAKLSIPVLRPLWEAFESFGPEGAAMARAYDGDGKWATFVSAGFRYDPGDWFVMSEWGRGDSRTDLGTTRAWYASGGYRFGAFTPYLTYSRGDGGHRTVRGLTPSFYPPELAFVAAGLNAVLDDLRAYTVVQRTVSVGARWDVVRNVTGKVQYERVDVGRYSIGSFGNLEPGVRPGGAGIFSLSVDLIF